MPLLPHVSHQQAFRNVSAGVALVTRPAPMLPVLRGASVGAAAPATDPRGVGQTIEEKGKKAWDWVETLIFVTGVGVLAYALYTVVQKGKTVHAVHGARRAAVVRSVAPARPAWHGGGGGGDNTIVSGPPSFD